MLPALNLSFTYLNVIDNDANIGARTAPMKPQSTMPPKRDLKVGDIFPVGQGIPNVVTLMGNRFVLTDDEVLEDHVNGFMAGSDAIPPNGFTYFVRIYVSQGVVMEQYNTLIITWNNTTTSTGTGTAHLLFSISLARTTKGKAYIYELDTDIDLYTLDFHGYDDELLRVRTALQDKLVQNGALLHKLPALLRVDNVISEEDSAFLNEPDPADTEIKMRAKRKRSATKREVTIPADPQTPPKKNVAEPVYFTPQVVELDSDSD